MNVKEMSQQIGKCGLLRIDGAFKVSVVIEDVRQTFGRIDFCVHAVDGHGSMWVESSRVHFE